MKPLQLHYNRIAGLIFLLLTLTFTTVPAHDNSLGHEGAGGSLIDSLPEPDRQILNSFLFLCDLAAEALEPEPLPAEEPGSKSGKRMYPFFFVDSYAVRALAVAWDLTGRERYLAACRTWSNRMLRNQKGMLPQGAYYMNYSRKMGESTGEWYVADCSSIVMGVLATAARCSDKTERKRYLDSARSFAKLVIENYLRPSGGITDGSWEQSDKEWWCSTALFASFAFQMYGLTGEEKYRAVALNALDWLLDFGYDETTNIYPFEKGAPTTIFYTLEAYAAGVPYLEPGSARQKEVFRKFSLTVEWIVNHQNAAGSWDYEPDNWGMKLGGLPCHLLTYLNSVPDTAERGRPVISERGKIEPFANIVSLAVDKSIRYFAAGDASKMALTQQDAFTMLSFAERLCPGELYRKRSFEFPYKRYSEAELSEILKKVKNP